MAFGKYFQLAAAQHLTAVIHELAEGACGLEAGQARQIDGGFGVSAPLEHTPGART
jgi:hypothetical protein